MAHSHHRTDSAMLAGARAPQVATAEKPSLAPELQQQYVAVTLAVLVTTRPTAAPEKWSALAPFLGNHAWILQMSRVLLHLNQLLFPSGHKAAPREFRFNVNFGNKHFDNNPI